jgi:hypothetical protein
LSAGFHQIPDQSTKATVFGDLPPGRLHGVRRDDPRDGLAPDLPGQRPTGTVTGFSLLGTVARGLAAPPVALHKGALSEVSYLDDLGFQLVSVLDELLYTRGWVRHWDLLLNAVTAFRLKHQRLKKSSSSQI